MVRGKLISRSLWVFCFSHSPLCLNCVSSQMRVWESEPSDPPLWGVSVVSTLTEPLGVMTFSKHCSQGNKAVAEHFLFQGDCGQCREHISPGPAPPKGTEPLKNPAFGKHSAPVACRAALPSGLQQPLPHRRQCQPLPSWGPVFH